MIEIKHRITAAVLHTVEAHTLENADLSDADLCGADLSGVMIAADQAATLANTLGVEVMP